MTSQTVDELIEMLERALSKKPSQRSHAELADAIREVFKRSHTLVHGITHTKEGRDWIRFAGENDNVSADAFAKVVASQALTKLRALTTALASAIDVLIVAALDDELRSLRRNYTLRDVEEPFPHQLGQIGDHDVVVVRCAGMGLVEAAISTTRALCHYRPRLVVMIGVCGAIEEKAKIGDVIVANPAFHYQFGAFNAGALHHELKSIPLKDQLADVADSFRPRFRDLLRSFDADRRPRPPKPSDMHIAPMACADLVVRDSRKIREAKSAERKTTGIDMESYAVMRTCRAFQDVPCIVVKAVQDVMDGKTDRYRSYAADLATSVLLAMLPKLVATT